MNKKKILFILASVIIVQTGWTQKHFPNLVAAKNSINYKGNPKNATDRKPLAFSDKGAWFAFGFLDVSGIQAGFSGPFLMTEQNGVWLSPSFVALQLKDENKQEVIDWKSALVQQNSYNSHLEQEFKNEKIRIKQELVFLSGHSALQKTSITNTSSKTITLFPSYSSTTFLTDVQVSNENKTLKIVSPKSTAIGYIQFLNTTPEIQITQQGYQVKTAKLVVKPKETKEIVVSQTYIFPQYSWENEKEVISKTAFSTLLNSTQKEKENQLSHLISKKKKIYNDIIYSNLIAKLVLTLQNNTRIPAEGLKHGGLFPSYNYEWFHGFWAWDSWKHAVAIANYDTELAKNQMRALFDYQEPNGFIPDCIYRNNLIEENNYRNTKAPLAAWAIWKIYEKTKEINFIQEFYPKLKLYHNWWYNERDHDKDGLCEYGSTDGTLLAAKWESGMDNAVRFDDSKLLKNGEKAYSLDQESVDLNAFLYAEKNYLFKMAKVLNLTTEATKWQEESVALKVTIQNQFWDAATSWFYDTTIDGKTLIKAMGCEGYIPIWAEAASAEQTKTAKENMLDTKSLNTFVPLPTLAANHPKFKPDNGYWRGPVWIDQSYFGINGLEKYGYQNEANQLTNKLMHNAEGVLDKGKTIRENYQPITGKGLEAYNFSWSAAHYLMLLLENE